MNEYFDDDAMSVMPQLLQHNENIYVHTNDTCKEIKPNHVAPIDVTHIIA